MMLQLMYHTYHFYLEFAQISNNKLVFDFWKTYNIVYFWRYDVMNDVVGTSVTYQTKAHYITLPMRYNT